jgi:hypothetical protein
VQSYQPFLIIKIITIKIISGQIYHGILTVNDDEKHKKISRERQDIFSLV